MDKSTRNIGIMDNKRLNFELIVERLKKQFVYRSDKELAQTIGMSPTAFHNRKKTGSLPYPEIIDFANSRNVNLNWVLSGEGPVYNKEILSENTAPEGQLKNLRNSGDEKIFVEHQDIIKRFKDPEKTKKFIEYLANIEDDDPHGYDKLFREAEIISKTIDRMNKLKQKKGVRNTVIKKRANGR